MRAVARCYSFEASHHVDGLGEQWSHPHHHSYTVEVIVVQDEPGSGAIVDTDELDVRWREHPILHGTYLNEKLADTTAASTLVEDLAAYFLEWFGSPVSQVIVWEDRGRWGSAGA